jgi:hypothetical protein
MLLVPLGMMLTTIHPRQREGGREEGERKQKKKRNK